MNTAPEETQEATPVPFRPAHRWWDILLVPLLALGGLAALTLAGMVVAWTFDVKSAEFRVWLERQQSSPASLYMMQVALYLAVFFIIGLLVRLRRLRMRDVHFPRLRAGPMLGAAISGAVLAVLAMLLLSLLPAETQQHLMEQSDLLMPETLGEAALLLIVVVLLAPLVEELYFRGVVLRVLGARLPFVAAAAITSAFFSAMHGHLFVSPDLGGWVLTGVLFVVGFLLACWARFTGSLRPAIAMHATYNFVLFLPSVAAMLAGVQT